MKWAKKMAHTAKTIMTLTDSCCRWPIGDPKHKDFHFCGKRKLPGQSYCVEHFGLAYQRPSHGGREGRPTGLPSKTDVLEPVPVAA